MQKLLTKILSKVVLTYDSLCGRYTVVEVNELPDKLKEKKLYAVGENGQYWLAALRCPCGCGDVIQLPMLEGQRPRWKLSDQNLRYPELSPSIDRTKKCRSHFWLRRGKIHWC